MSDLKLRCSDGTYEHVWEPMEESDTTHIERCVVCGQGRITTTHTGAVVIRYRRGYQPRPVIRPGEDGGEPSPCFAQVGVPIPQTATEKQRERMRREVGR